MQGNLEKENFIGLLQTLGAQKATGVLSVYQLEVGESRIYFREGRIIHAHRGNTHDHKLVMNLLVETKGTFEFKPEAKPSLETVNQSLDNFLLEVGRLRFAFGAAGAAQDELEPNQIPKVLNPTRLKEMRFSADDNWLVIHLDGAHTVAQLLTMERRPGQVGALLRRLQNLGLIELSTPVASPKSVSQIPALPTGTVVVNASPERLSQMHFSIDEFNIIMNLDGKRTLAELQSFERSPGQLQALLGHLIQMGLLQVQGMTPAVDPKASESVSTSISPSTSMSVSISTTVTTSVNVDTLADLDPEAIPVILDDARFKETRFSADDNWLVVHFDGRNIEALQKLEKRKGHLKMVIYRLINKGLIELRSPAKGAAKAQVAESREDAASAARVPALFDQGQNPVLNLSGQELSLLLKLDGERSIDQIQRFESSPGQLSALVQRLEQEGLCEIRSRPLRLRIGISSDLSGQSLAIDQAVLENWEKRLGKSIWRAKLHLPTGVEHSCEVMASTGADAYVLLSEELVTATQAVSGAPALIYPE